MRAISRAARAAQNILAREKISEPAILVEQIAEKYAKVRKLSLPEDISGMLVPLPDSSDGSRWAIVINSQHPSVRQRFTIAHELGHLLLHRYMTPHADGRFQVRFRDELSGTGTVREEIEANQFAAELLMPESLLIKHLSTIGFDYADVASDAQTLRKLNLLARKYQVSVQALSFRVANLSALGA